MAKRKAALPLSVQKNLRESKQFRKENRLTLDQFRKAAESRKQKYLESNSSITQDESSHDREKIENQKSFMRETEQSLSLDPQLVLSFQGPDGSVIQILNC